MDNGNAKQPMIELIDASLGYAEEREATLIEDRKSVV